MFSDLEARVRSTENGDVYVVREGSQVELAESSYVIGALSDSPPEAMVTKVSIDGGKRLSKLLKPSATDDLLNQDQGTYSPFAIRPKIVSPKPNS